MVLNVAAFGALGNGVTDDTPAFLAALAAVPPSGAIIEIPDGIYPISSTLVITTPNTPLHGAGGSSWSNSSWAPATTIKWIGAIGGTMLDYHAVWGTAVPALHRSGLSGLMLDGNMLAGVALKVFSVAFGSFCDFAIVNPLHYGILTGCVPWASPTNDPRDTQNCEFAHVAIRTAETDAVCICLTGDLQIANTSYNLFRNLALYGKDAPELIVQNGDNNVFRDVRCFHAGHGPSVLLDGTDPGYVQFNSFYHLTPQGGFLQRGAFATMNAVYEYDMSQGAPVPVIADGLLTWTGMSAYGMHYATQVVVKNASNGSGFRAENVDPAASSGLDMYDFAGAFVGNLAYRGPLNPVLPDTMAMVVGGKDFAIATNYAERVRVPAAGGLVIGTTPIATSAIDGFLYLPTCAGTPTGTPTTRPGRAMVYDTTAHKLWIYDAGAWRSAAFL